MNTHATDAASMEHITTYHLKCSMPRAAPSICGTPLPRIMGMRRVAVPITSAPAARPINSNGINAGFCTIKEYNSVESSSPMPVTILYSVTTAPANSPVSMPRTTRLRPYSPTAFNRFFMLFLPLISLSRKCARKGAKIYFDIK